MKAWAFSRLSDTSLSLTWSVGTQPHASLGFMYVAAFHSFPSPASLRNCFQCELLAFSIVRVYARRDWRMSSNSAKLRGSSCPASAQLSCYLRRRRFTSFCSRLRSAVNQRFAYREGLRSGVCLSTASAVNFVRFSTAASSASVECISSCPFMRPKTSFPIFS
jgi:hypothetical protein